MNMINYDNELILSNEIYSIEDIKKIIKEVISNYDVEEVYLFGSYARNEANEESDIDIMIKKSKSFSLLQLSSLANVLMEKFKKNIDIITQETYTEEIKYDDNEIKSVKKRFYDEIRKEMVKIYG